MTLIDVFQVWYKNNGVFYSGDTLDGCIHFEISEPIEVKSLKVHIKGKAFTSWTEQRGTGSKTRTTLLSGEKTYIDEVISIKTTVLQETLQLTPGSHNFPFQYELDSELPSTLEASNGHIRYFCRGIIEGPKVFKTITAFTVVRPLDLCKNPMFMNPVQARNHRELTCCGFDRGEVVATMGLRRVAYVPGESILISAHVKNNSKSTIRGTSAVLKKVTKATGHINAIFSNASSGTCERHDVVAEVQGGQVDKGQSGQWNDVPLLVPPLPPSTSENFKTSDLITVTYLVQFRVKIKYGNEIQVEEPVLIGSSPFDILPPSTAVEGPVTSQPSSQGHPITAQASQNEASFIECQSSSYSTRDEGDEYTHVPSYPFYYGKNIPTLSHDIPNEVTHQNAQQSPQNGHSKCSGNLVATEAAQMPSTCV